VDNLGRIAPVKDVNQVVWALEACAVEHIKWASRRDLQIDTAKMEAALFTCRRGHKKYLRPKLTAKIKVGDGFVRCNRDATRWLGEWMDTHLTFKEHHSCSMMKARPAEARLHVLTRMHGIVPERVKAIQLACFQAVELYGSK
jgi:hypothetical protein